MDASNGAVVEYTSDGEISEQMSARVSQSLQSLVKRKIKILLMGQSSSGKTSMRSVLFANYQPIDTRSLSATDGFEVSHVKIFGEFMLNIWDCGGQETFDDNYVSSKRNNKFQNVDVLIYVFDLSNRDEEIANDLNYYETCLSGIYEHSPSAQVFCLMHKMDLVTKDQRKKLFEDREMKLINMSKPIKITCFMTSIWDESLYEAWSSIVYRLIPNIQDVEKLLKLFADVMECKEVILFDQGSILVLAKHVRVPHTNINRFQTILKNIKRLKQICNNNNTKLTLFETKYSNVREIVCQCSASTYLMVVTINVFTEMTLFNIKPLKLQIEKLEKKCCQLPENHNSI